MEHPDVLTPRVPKLSSSEVVRSRVSELAPLTE